MHFEKGWPVLKFNGLAAAHKVNSFKFQSVVNHCAFYEIPPEIGNVFAIYPVGVEILESPILADGRGHGIIVQAESPWGKIVVLVQVLIG